jgi:hypothetical protein
VVVVVVHSFGARRERGVCGSARGESEREGVLFAYLLGSRAATAFIRSPVPRTSRATEAPRAAGALARGPLRAERRERTRRRLQMDKNPSRKVMMYSAYREQGKHKEKK